jgi:hypothetical protein
MPIPSDDLLRDGAALWRLEVLPAAVFAAHGPQANTLATEANV